MVWKCSWCGKYLGEREPLEDELIVGGACRNCLQRFEQELKVCDAESDLGGAHKIIKPPRMLGTVWIQVEGSETRYGLFLEE